MFKALTQFMEGKIEFNYFVNEYYDRYFDSDDLQYGEIHKSICEKIEFTDETVDSESKSHGWITVSEFKNWLDDFIENVKIPTLDD